mmetsp:Transcript_3718/g.4969  ORF Transcript_3718/g.4969 Transcript_3718/m.4969 type:complete len:85 (-) Transcript_3718:1628-1882(-)
MLAKHGCQLVVKTRLAARPGNSSALREKHVERFRLATFFSPVVKRISNFEFLPLILFEFGIKAISLRCQGSWLHQSKEELQHFR